MSGASLLLALSCIFVLAIVVPPGLATLVNRTRVDRAERDVTELAAQIEQAWTRRDGPAMTVVDVLAGEGSMPAVPEGSGWSTARTASLGEYVPAAPEEDPWGNRYLVNVGAARAADLKVRPTRETVVWVLSAGPNGIVETPFAASNSSVALGGDDIGARIALNPR